MTERTNSVLPIHLIQSNPCSERQRTPKFDQPLSIFDIDYRVADFPWRWRCETDEVTSVRSISARKKCSKTPALNVSTVFDGKNTT